jgi:hypothetical protein
MEQFIKFGEKMKEENGKNRRAVNEEYDRHSYDENFDATGKRFEKLAWSGSEHGLPCWFWVTVFVIMAMAVIMSFAA